jgi:hypothetical protein
VVWADYERVRIGDRSCRESLVSASRRLLKVVYTVLRDRKTLNLQENLSDP